MSAIERLHEQGEVYRVFDPLMFEALKEWLHLLEQLTETASLSAAERALKASFLLSPVAGELLSALPEAQRATAQAKTDPQRRRALHVWFDAFRTLKFFHLLRNNGLPNVPLEDALKKAAFIPGAPVVKDHGLQHLKNLERNRLSGKACGPTLQV
jgi:hypothetical protein